MTFTEIVNKVADRMNLTAATALTRIGDSVNERYRTIASSIGLDTIERQTITASTIIGNRSLVFTCEKILSIYNTAFTPVLVLDEISMDLMRNQVLGTDPAQQYAIQLMGASTVTVYLGSTPATIYPLSADALVNLSTLSGSQVPAFAQDFHDALVLGAMATELYKMEKYALADKKEEQFMARLSDLRFFIAKSAYRQMYQGSRAGGPIVVPMI